MEPKLLTSSLLISLVFPAIVLAQPRAPDTPISGAAKSEVIETLDRKLKSSYVFPDVAERVSKALAERMSGGQT